MWGQEGLHGSPLGRPPWSGRTVRPGACPKVRHEWMVLCPNAGLVYPLRDADAPGFTWCGLKGNYRSCIQPSRTVCPITRMSMLMYSSSLEFVSLYSTPRQRQFC